MKNKEKKETKLKLNIYTDGSCLKNPGKGGWAYVVTNSTDSKVMIEKSGGERYTTNNRMEIQAVINSIKDFKKYIDKKGIAEYKLNIYSDSSYCVNSVNKKWIKKWMENGWKTSRGTDVLNRDLWEEIINLSEDISFKLIKIKGHSGEEFNEKCDKLAKDAALNA